MSHRWSPQPSLLLSKDTTDELRQGFDAARLPAAIQDATSVCKRLGVRYLWVDTLCILQNHDDLADWEKESSLMGKVYENSLLNLSALAAADTEHSFFAKRNPLAISEVQVHTQLTCKSNKLELGRTVNEYRLVDGHFWKTSIQNAPLNKRAWVMQEKLLPVRVLYFGYHQLLWECATLKAAETYPNGLIGETDIEEMSMYKWPETLDFRELIGEGALQKLLQNKDNTRAWNAGLSNDPEIIYNLVYDAWDLDVVRKYSWCKATKGSDKLIAISGLAGKMASIVNDQYVVGMWRRRLLRELMWICDNDQMSKLEAEYPGPRRPKASYRAPSFSWASVNAIIEPCWGDIKEGTTCIRIVDVELDFVAANNPISQCKGGYLVLQCRLQRAVFTHREGPLLVGQGFIRRTLVTLHLTMSNGSLVEDDSPELDELPSHFEPVGRHDLYGVPWEDTSWDFCGYLLLQAVDPSAGVFQRIGTASIYHPENNWKEWGLSSGPEAANYPCLKYEDGWHTIKVISYLMLVVLVLALHSVSR